jgi:hypothetical protein
VHAKSYMCTVGLATTNMTYCLKVGKQINANPQISTKYRTTYSPKSSLNVFFVTYIFEPDHNKRNLLEVKYVLVFADLQKF